YGLEATGAFPYVRVIALQQHSAPVPVEAAPVPGVIKRQHERLADSPAPATHKPRPAAKRRSRPLTRRLHSNHDKPLCSAANSQSCLDCHASVASHALDVLHLLAAAPVVVARVSDQSG